MLKNIRWLVLTTLYQAKVKVYLHMRFDGAIYNEFLRFTWLNGLHGDGNPGITKSVSLSTKTLRAHTECGS
jgi:hypothetical protein